MKFSDRCPKCGSADIVKESKQNNIHFNNYISVKKNWASFVSLTRYICLHCGYTEEWVDDPQDLEKIEKKLKNNKDYDGFV